MIITSRVKEIPISCRHFHNQNCENDTRGVMSSKLFTVNIEMLIVNIVISNYNPHDSYILFDSGMFMAVLVVYK